MAVTAANLTAPANPNASGASATTASISPTANRLIICAVYQKRSAGNSTVPTVSGASMTWTQIATLSANSTQRVTLFRALSAAPGSGALTIDFAGVSQDNIGWSVDEFNHVDTSGTNGANAIIQSATNSAASGTSLAATLSALTSAANVAYGFIGTDGGSAMTKGASFTQLSNSGAAGGQTNSEWAINQTAVNWTWTSSVPNLSMAIEIKAGGSGGFFAFL